MSILQEYHPKAFNKKKVVVERFSSASEVLMVSNTRSRTSSSFKDYRKQVAEEPDWYGASSWDEVEDLMAHGYSPYVKKLNSKLNFKGKGEGKRISFRNDVVGYAPVVPLAMMGVPNSMVNSYLKPMKNKVVSIYYDKTANAGITAWQIEEAGLKLLSVLIDLEMQGYRFNLYVTESHAENGACDMLAVKVKDSTSPFDMQRLSFPIGHPAFFRGIGFDWYSRCPKATYRWGLGHALNHDWDDKHITDAFNEIFNEKCVVFQCEKLINDSEQHIADVITSANATLK